MGIVYSEMKANSLIDEAIAQSGSELYRQRFLNWKGFTSDTGKLLVELVSEKIYNNEIEILVDKPNLTKEKFTSCPLHRRDEIFYTEYRPGEISRDEDNIAKRIFETGEKIVVNDDIYEVIDYQVPVIRIHKSKHGKIDLVLRQGQNILIGELKDEDSDESLLRAVIEIETYYRKVSHEKLLQCYMGQTVNKAILLFSGTRPMLEFDNKDYYWSNRLLCEYNITVFEVTPESPLDSVLPQYNRFNLHRIN